MSLVAKMRVAMTMIMSAGLVSACSLMPKSSDAAYSVQTDVPYVLDGDPRQRADLYVPKGAGPFPAVMVIHGGGWARGEPADMEKYAKRLVADGYVVMNLSYRLAPQHHFPAQTDDVAAAHRWLVTHAKQWRVDPDRIAALGYSAGAHLALMLGLNSDSQLPRLRAIIAGAGPTDVTVYPNSPYLLDLIGGPGDEYPDQYAAASPVNYVSADDPPVLLYHGTWDRLVEIEQSRKMARALEQAKVEYELIETPLMGHITNFVFDGATYERIELFLARHMSNEPKIAGEFRRDDHCRFPATVEAVALSAKACLNLAGTVVTAGHVATAPAVRFF